MIGIKMKPNIPVHYQKGEHNPLPLPPPPNIFIFFIFYFYFICTKIVLQEKIIPPHTTPKHFFNAEALVFNSKNL